MEKEEEKCQNCHHDKHEGKKCDSCGCTASK